MKTFNKLLLLNYKSKTLKSYLNLGSKLYYMNKDGGLSFFDVASNQVTEVLDNTTFVSIIKFLFHYFFPRNKNSSQGVLWIIFLAASIMDVCIQKRKQTQVRFFC